MRFFFFLSFLFYHSITPEQTDRQDRHLLMQNLGNQKQNNNKKKKKKKKTERRVSRHPDSLYVLRKPKSGKKKDFVAETTGQEQKSPTRHRYR